MLAMAMLLYHHGRLQRFGVVTVELLTVHDHQTRCTLLLGWQRVSHQGTGRGGM
jgi:hypothetical protein